MRFHEYRTLWSEMQGRLSSQVTEEMFYATAMAGGDNDANAAIAGVLLGVVHGRSSSGRWMRCGLPRRGYR